MFAEGEQDPPSHSSLMNADQGANALAIAGQQTLLDSKFSPIQSIKAPSVIDDGRIISHNDGDQTRETLGLEKSTTQ